VFKFAIVFNSTDLSPQGMLLHRLRGVGSGVSIMLSYEADGEPFRLLAGFEDGTLAVIDPEAGTMLHLAQDLEKCSCHQTFETEDGRLILALSGRGGLVMLYDLGEAPSRGARVLPAANKLG
jgi:hypothetical protein